MPVSPVKMVSCRYGRRQCRHGQDLPARPRRWRSICTRMKQLNPHSSDGDAAHEDFEQVTAKAFDFALAVVGHELGAAERQQAMAT